jgi:hypothetical protein
MEVLLIIFFLGFIIAIPAMFIVPVWLLRKRRNKVQIAETGKCEVCGKSALRLKQTRTSGLLIFFQIERIDSYLCLEHAEHVYKEVMSHNLRRGWWSISGILRTPVLIQENMYYFSQLKKNTKESNTEGKQ